MKLSKWATIQGIEYQTAWRMFKAGQIPTAYKLPTGTIIVPDDAAANIQDYTVVYTRVSSSENKSNLDSQAERVSNFCHARGWIVNKVVKECASGLNDSRPKLLAILSDPRVTRIVVEHKDRLTRFGFNYIKQLSKADIVIINEAADDTADLMQDFVSLVTSFAARIYGHRRSSRKTEQLIKALTEEE